MNYGFSKRFLPIIDIAYEQAQAFGSPVILSEHFFYGVLSQKDSVLLKILNQLNVDVESIRKDLAEYISSHKEIVPNTPVIENKYKLSHNALRLVQCATAEARKMNAPIIGGEHLLLATKLKGYSYGNEFFPVSGSEY